MKARFVSPTERVLYFKSLPWLQHLEVTRLISLAEYAEERFVPAGRGLVPEDEPIDAVHFPVSGRAAVWWNGVKALECEPPRAVGFEGLIIEGDLSPRIVALEDCTTLAIDAEILLDTMENQPELMAALFELYANEALDLRDRMPVPLGTTIDLAGLPWTDHSLDLVDRLRTIWESPIARLNVDAMLPMVRAMKELRLPPGQVIWEAGEPSGFAVSMLNGDLRCELPDGRSTRITGRFTVGFDELFARRPHAYRLVTEAPTLALRIDRAPVLSLIDNHHDVARRWLGFLMSDVVMAYAAAASGVPASSHQLVSRRGHPSPGARVTEARPSALDRFLRLFSDVRAGEGLTVVLLLTNIFLVLTSYYVLKTVREPLILAGGGAAVKTYASAGQALVLVGFVPLYSWFAARVPRFTLINGVTLFFVACIGLFYGLAYLDVPYLGVAFYVWVGIFSVSIIAQFWSYANDLYSRDDGERLFPVIAIGATGGAAGGAWLAARLFDLGVGAYEMMLVAGAMLLASVAIYAVVDRRQTASATTTDTPKLDAGGGFGLVLRSPYLRLIALLLILLNLVNTTGEYVLSSFVEEAAAAVAEPGSKAFGAYIGSFYGDYFFYVNIGTILIQAFVVSRIVKVLGVAGVIFALPIVSLSAYALIAAGSGLAIVRWAKSAENMTDYSVMNTGKAMLWLPTTRDQKYKAKQAVDTFFVRLGDVLAAGLVFAGTTWLGFERITFVWVNMGVIVAWLGVTWLVFAHYSELATPRDDVPS